MFHPAPVSLDTGVVSCHVEEDDVIDNKQLSYQETSIMSRVQELETKVSENKKFIESKRQQIKALQAEIEALNNEIADDEAEIAKIKSRRDAELKDALVTVFEQFADVDGLQGKVIEIVIDHFEETNMSEEPVSEQDPQVVAHRADVEAKEFQETIGFAYPNSEMGAREASAFVKEIAEAHKNNPAAANATYYMLLDRWAHLFDLDGLAVVKDAKATMDKLLPPKPDDLSDIPF